MKTGRLVSPRILKQQVNAVHGAGPGRCVHPNEVPSPGEAAAAASVTSGGDEPPF
jgi:hypothetical protein